MADPVSYRMGREMLSGGFGMSVASVLLNPLDVVKVRIQQSPELYRGMVDCARVSVGNAGGFFRGLWLPGLSATLFRDLLNGSFRVGLYKEVERTLFPSDEVPIVLQKIITGIFVGSLAGLWSPTDLIKTRMQVDPEYSSLLKAYNRIRLSEGFSGLYRGVCPNLLRASLITTSHVSSYDLSKRFLRNQHVEEGILSWTFSGFCSALVTTTVSAPVDLVRTRVMASHTAVSAASIFASIILKEGTIGLFRGWWPSFYRFGPHFTLSWPLIELARTRVFGLGEF